MGYNLLACLVEKGQFLEYAKEHNIPIADQYLSRLGGAMRKKKSSEAAVF